MNWPITSPFWRTRARRRLAALLERTILGFWRHRALAEDGGYHLDFDHAGARSRRAPAMLIDQSDMLWFFSRLARSPFRDAFSDDAAHRGFEFLEAVMRDPHHGGYFWHAPDREAAPGQGAENGLAGWWRTKHLCGQAFALLALSEYARDFASPAAAAAARELFALIRRHGPDPDGGYREVLARDWSAAPAEHVSLLGPYPATAKTSGTHIHLLEAFTAYDRIATGADVHMAMTDVAGLLTQHETRPATTHVNGTESSLFADYAGPQRQPCLSVGHNIKSLWYRLAALERLGIAMREARAILRKQFEFVLAAGYDRADGGFFNWVALNQPVKDATKLWWVQAEGLLGSLIFHVRCGSAPARHSFLGTLAWIERYQADWRHGEWHAEIRGRSVKPAPKAGPWKTAFHPGRAMLEGIELLDGA